MTQRNSDEMMALISPQYDWGQFIPEDYAEEPDAWDLDRDDDDALEAELDEMLIASEEENAERDAYVYPNGTIGFED